MSDPQALYKTLGVPKDATPEVITKMWRRLVKRHHPDKNPGDPDAKEKYARIDEAYRILSDPTLRAEYDRTGEVPRQRGQAVDPEHAELAAVLQPLLIEVLQNADDHGGGIRQCRVVDRVKERLTEIIQRAERHRSAVEKGLEGLRFVAGRFTVSESDKPNVMDDLVRRQISGLENDLVNIKKELDKLTRVKAYLAIVGYTFGGSGDPFAAMRAVAATNRFLLGGY